MSNNSNSMCIHVGTYNVLAQALMRREMFPYAAKSALKWNNRSQTQFSTIEAANVDVLCLQEVDVKTEIQWGEFLTSIGYEYVFHAKTSTKATHGLIFAYKKCKFQLVAAHAVHFDRMQFLARDGLEAEDQSFMNIAQLVVLMPLHMDKDIAKVPLFLFSNTHLQWKTIQTYTKMRQVHMLLSSIAALKHNQPTKYKSCLDQDLASSGYLCYDDIHIYNEYTSVAIPYRNNQELIETEVVCIMSGDFNSSPKTMAYSFIKSRCLAAPFPQTSAAKNTNECLQREGYYKDNVNNRQNDDQNSVSMMPSALEEILPATLPTQLSPVGALEHPLLLLSLYITCGAHARAKTNDYASETFHLLPRAVCTWFLETNTSKLELTTLDKNNHNGNTRERQGVAGEDIHDCVLFAKEHANSMLTIQQILEEYNLTEQKMTDLTLSPVYTHNTWLMLNISTHAILYGIDGAQEDAQPSYMKDIQERYLEDPEKHTIHMITPPLPYISVQHNQAQYPQAKHTYDAYFSTLGKDKKPQSMVEVKKMRDETLTSLHMSQQLGMLLPQRYLDVISLVAQMHMLAQPMFKATHAQYELEGANMNENTQYHHYHNYDAKKNLLYKNSSNNNSNIDIYTQASSILQEYTGCCNGQRDDVVCSCRDVREGPGCTTAALWSGALDFIFYPDTCTAKAKLTETYAECTVNTGLPDLIHGSDHILVQAQITWNGE